VFLALYPGHLPNLQWGWQVAVFLCLVGVAIAIRMLSLATLSWMHTIAAVVATIAALLSFATAAALIPTALVLIAMHREASYRMRIAFASPWLALGALFLLRIDAPATAAMDFAHAGDLLLYILNFIGSGLARFATGIAPWLATAGLISATWAFATTERRNESLPWLGLVLFAVFAGALVALGRAAPFGESHAFVTRYVSFSSLFWLGWTGLMANRLTERGGGASLAIGLVAALALANALHMVKKAYEVGTRATATERAIRATYPRVDRALLGEIYFDQPDVALSRLETLRALGFAPFDRQDATVPN